MSRRKPLIGVISDRRKVGHHHFHMVGEKYLQAVVDASNAYPVALPSLNDDFAVIEALEDIDGLLLTGSPSNVRPVHYNAPPAPDDSPEDPQRDRAVFDLIPAAIRAGVPLFAICRGCQELNVAFGGTLHPAVHKVRGMFMHQENKDDPIEVQYGPSHDVEFTSGGLLEQITGVTRAKVNSVHGQGICELGDGLRIEATAPDGLVEAVVVQDAPAFALGVQWHPEWRVRDNEVSMALFQAFGDACREYRS